MSNYFAIVQQSISKYSAIVQQSISNYFAIVQQSISNYFAIVQQSISKYSAIVQQSISNYCALVQQSHSISEPQDFPTILGKFNTVFFRSLSGLHGEFYDNQYSGTGGVIEVGKT